MEVAKVKKKSNCFTGNGQMQKGWGTKREALKRNGVCFFSTDLTFGGKKRLKGGRARIVWYESKIKRKRKGKLRRKEGEN